MSLQYDSNNIFAKIIKSEIPCNKIYENDFALSFYDINPQTKIHCLVIPKGSYLDIEDFSKNASSEEKIMFFEAISKTIEKLDVKEGFRTIANTKSWGGQEVYHFHMHILGGEKLGKMLP